MPEKSKKQKKQKTAAVEISKPHNGKTRAPEAPLDKGAADGFKEVQPEGFKDHGRSSLEAAVVDPDMQDTEGGE